VRSFEVGVNFYDTADAYGDGYGETVMGEALKELPREQLVVATKVYHHFFPDGRRYGDLSREYILQACENSLRRLKMDYIDLYQCHAFDPMTDPAETADAMETLLKQGKIRAYGSSNWTVEQMRTADRFGNFATTQPIYSLLQRDIEDDILPYCRAHNTGVLVYSPLHKGLLSGKYKGNETFTDFRKSHKDFTGERFKMLTARVAEAGKIAQGYGLSTLQLILVVTLMNPALTCAIVGIKTPEQIEEAAGAMGKSVSREDAWKVRNLLTNG
jgi:aryl-alcohol dehydrogenase-like predicted oxidoreductase